MNKDDDGPGGQGCEKDNSEKRHSMVKMVICLHSKYLSLTIFNHLDHHFFPSRKDFLQLFCLHHHWGMIFSKDKYTKKKLNKFLWKQNIQNWPGKNKQTNIHTKDKF